MAAQGRKNVHGKTGVRFKAAYTSSKYKAMLRNVVTELIVHERVVVTLGVAKDVKNLAERMVTKAKNGDLHNRRLAAAVIRPEVYADAEKKVTALDKLFAEIGPRYKERNGGYTRVLKMVPRRGDNAEMAIVEFVK
ncbi:MAG: 50S ribosomal protein L17 [Erysipelotrichales bacterium]|nr:50S ribosomal protein L17 [Erysipelotrichales bacterium]